MARRTISEQFVVEGGIVKAGMVEVTVTVRQGRGAEAVELIKDMAHTLDFKGCKLEDLVDAAAANAVIELQNGVWRSMSSQALKDEAGKVTSMKERYERERTRTAPDPMKALLNKVSKGEVQGEVLTDLIAQLTKLAGGVK